MGKVAAKRKQAVRPEAGGRQNHRAMHIATKTHLSRCAFLRGPGAALALPWLEAMVPAFAARTQAAKGPVRRGECKIIATFGRQMG